jgi:hypothetical protein
MKSAALVVLALAGCGPKPATAVHNAQSQPKLDTSTRAASLADAMRLRGLTPITLASIKQEMSSALGTQPTQHGRELVVFETAGWNASPAVFARRESDGKIVIVTPAANTIVDRHEAAGCLHFAGGRGWFEEVTYRLPEGATFAGNVKVEYDQHIVAMDYSDRQPDGSPCPPPAID